MDPALARSALAAPAARSPLGVDHGIHKLSDISLRRAETPGIIPDDRKLDSRIEPAPRRDAAGGKRKKRLRRFARNLRRVPVFRYLHRP
jgi:hypothetical protein